MIKRKYLLHALLSSWPGIGPESAISSKRSLATLAFAQRRGRFQSETSGCCFWNPSFACLDWSSRCVLGRESRRSFVPFWPFSVDTGVSGKTGRQRDTAWDAAVSEAEKIVGYPTSFMSLRLLLSDEVSNVAMQLRKLVGTQHPLLGTAKALLYDERQSVQTRGLIVLLLAKTIGAPPHGAQGQSGESSSSFLPSPSWSSPGTTVSGIHEHQRSIAEITEVIYMADLIHKGLLDMKEMTQDQASMIGDIAFANRMAVLAGDFLLANACTGLAKLGCTQAVDLVASAIANLMEARFILDGTERSSRSDDKSALHRLTLTTREETDAESTVNVVHLTQANWQKKTYLGVGSLLAKACDAALLVVGHDASVRAEAREFATKLVFAHQVKADVEQFEAEVADSKKRKLRVLSAPAVLHARSHGLGAFLETPNSGVCTAQDDGDASTIVLTSPDAFKEAVRAGPGMSLARELGRRYREEAVQRLERFPDGESRSALENVLNSMSLVS